MVLTAVVILVRVAVVVGVLGVLERELLIMKMVKDLLRVEVEAERDN
jgi:hypothetical protein